MKIGIITDSVREQSTGIGFYTKDVVEKLLSKDKKNKYIFIDYLKTEFNKHNLHFVSYPFRYYKTILWHALLPYRIRNLKMDYILNFSGNPHLLPYRQKEIFFVYDISWYLFPHLHPASRSLMYRISFKRCLKNSYKIIVDSISTKQDLINYFAVDENKIEVIYPTIPSKIKRRPSRQKNAKTPYVLFIGTLEPRKNITTIIKAFKKLITTQKIKHKLIICGKKGWLYEEIFTLIKKLQLENDVIYKGYITNEEKEHLLQNADCFVYPSLYEGFGIPVIEAMQAGCPVITSNVSSLPEVAGKSGILIDPTNVEELYSAMSTVLNDKKLRESNIREGFKQLQKLDNTKQIENLLRLISQ